MGLEAPTDAISARHLLLFASAVVRAMRRFAGPALRLFGAAADDALALRLVPLGEDCILRG